MTLGQPAILSFNHALVTRKPDVSEQKSAYMWGKRSVNDHSLLTFKPDMEIGKSKPQYVAFLHQLQARWCYELWIGFAEHCLLLVSFLGTKMQDQSFLFVCVLIGPHVLVRPLLQRWLGQHHVRWFGCRGYWPTGKCTAESRCVALRSLLPGWFWCFWSPRKEQSYRTSLRSWLPTGLPRFSILHWVAFYSGCTPCSAQTSTDGVFNQNDGTWGGPHVPLHCGFMEGMMSMSKLSQDGK